MERNTLEQLGASKDAVEKGGGGGGGGRLKRGGEGGGGGDPTSLEATVRRLVDAPEDPAVDKYVRMGYKRDAVVFGERRGGEGVCIFLFFFKFFFQVFFFRGSCTSFNLLPCRRSSGRSTFQPGPSIHTTTRFRST